MTHQEFDHHMNRLKDCFGDRSYSDERTKRIWREVRDFDSNWFEKIVDRFIGQERQPPILPQFQEETSIERERLWKIEKEQHARDAKEFFQGMYQPDDVRTICQFIVKRITGGVSDEDYANFVKHLKETADAISKHSLNCKECEDSGLVFTDQNYVYRCYCPQGRKRQENYPIWNRR
jgi:hypothetical protein